MVTRRYHRPRKIPIAAKAPHVRALFGYMDMRSITLRTASERSGVDERVISNWRSGASTPRLDLFVAVCESVGLVLSVALSSKVKKPNVEQMELDYERV